MKKILFILIVVIFLQANLIIAVGTNVVDSEDGDLLFNKDIDEEKKIGKKISSRLNDDDIVANKFHMVKVMDDETRMGTLIKLNSEGYINIRYQETNRGYKNFDYSKDSPKFVFDLNGNLIEAEFIAGITRVYKFENSNVYVPEGGKVIFKNRKVEVEILKDSDIKAPGAINKDEPRTTPVLYKFAKGEIKKLKANDGKSYEFSSSEGLKIGFDSQGVYFENKDLKIDEILIKNPKSKKVYFDFKGEVNGDYHGVYVSLNKNNKKFVTGSNTNENGPSVIFGKENNYGIIIEKGDDFSVRAEGGDFSSYVSIQSRLDKKKSALIKTYNKFSMNKGKVSPYFNVKSGRVLIKVTGNILKDYNNKNAGSVEAEVECYKTIDGIITNAFKGKNIMVFGDDGRVGVGPNPEYIKVKSDSYQEYGEPGLYRGVSHWLAYNEPPTTRTFKRFTGVNINDGVGLSGEKIRMLMDVFASIPRPALKNVKTLNIVNHWTLWAGLARPGEVNLHLNNGGVDPDTARHEITHVHDMVVGWSRNSKFDRQWNSIGGAEGPHTYNYGYTRHEDTSTFAEFIYKPLSWWRSRLSPSYKYNKKYKGRIAVFVWNNFMTRDEAGRLLSSVGLNADDNTLKKLFKEAQESYGGIG